MGVVFAIVLVVLCFGSLIIGFSRSMHRQRQRRMQVKSKWSPAPGGRGDSSGTH